ncbi:MAG: hypothetical protein JJE30_15125 [Desulfuromonadales bacterium]|nr:hypothetical protein [Desulfuromonadales bacterium]
MPPTGEEIRRVLLEVISEYSDRDASFQSGTILGESQRRLGINHNVSMEQALLTLWHDLFRTGYLAWGYNLSNPDPPFCHLTDQGRRTLQHLSRDPANPDGYLHHLNQTATLNPISNSYLKEALISFNTNCYKAAAVMIGASAESIVLELRDTLVAKIISLSRTPAKDLEDWRIKKVLDSLKKEIDAKRPLILTPLWEAYQGYWSAFTQQIRTVRNDAGHPTNIDPVTEESVHASLLIFPELAKLANDLSSWITTHYT